MLRKIMLGIVGGALTLSVAGVAAQQGGKDIVDTAAAAGSFTTLAKALAAADLVETLKGTGPYTVFAPTDEAFAKLPAATLDDLLKPENRAKLRQILLSHVVPGRVSAAEVIKLRSAKALSGDSIALTANGATVMVGGARVLKMDIAASNGVIHVIDMVILPNHARD